jgi:gamma-glutamyl-gamma-aminobutyrate hydrolase PuuD
VIPVVGITTYVTQARFGYWELETALIPADYVRHIEAAGGRPLLVPPSDRGVPETLDVLDGLILTGGEDIEPSLYGQDPHPETFGVYPARDDAELALLEGALERDLPVLAICRGIQLLNVALGGDLVQHLPDIVGHERHKETAGVFGEHEVRLDVDTRIREILGAQASVKSHHHQALGRLGTGLRSVATAEDGTVEAIEEPTKRFALGVQWHPEAGADSRLFAALVEEAAAYRAANGRASPAKQQ